MNPIEKLLNGPIKVIDVGLEMFFQDLKKRDVEVVHIEWKPPALGNQKLGDILKKMKGRSGQ